MTNFTGANVITASDVTKYQPDVFEFGIASGSTEATNYFELYNKSKKFFITEAKTFF